MPGWKKIVVMMALLLHTAAIVQNSLSGNLLYPQRSELSSRTELLRYGEQVFNRRDSDSWLDQLLRNYCRVAGISQQWNTFAPIPPKFVGSYSIVAIDDEGEATTVWTDGMELDSSGTGWTYDPNVKFLSVLGLPLADLQRQTVESLTADLDFTPSMVRLQVEYFYLRLDSEGQVVRTPTQTRVVVEFPRWLGVQTPRRLAV